MTIAFVGGTHRTVPLPLRERLASVSAAAGYVLSRKGANGLIGLDMETSDLGIGAGVIVISATGTAVVLEPEQS